MDEEKKTAHPLEGWVIASAHGQTLIGKPETPPGIWGDHWVKLLPVYQFISGMQPGKDQSTVNIVFKVMPLGDLLDGEEKVIPSDSLVVLVDSLDRTELGPITNAVAECEEMVRKTRAARAGLTLVEGARLPKGLPTLKDKKDRR